MSTTQPIKDKESLQKMKSYYENQKPNCRNKTLIIFGLYTALRISDILKLKWKDIYDAKTNQMKEYLEVKEEKTGKTKIIALNNEMCDILQLYKKELFNNRSYNENQYLFLSQKGENIPICRSQAFRIIKKAAIDIGLENHISCHSLRKTFGYHAWKQGVQPALLMDIYNHSSYKITKRYLCIEQEERDEVYRKITL